MFKKLILLGGLTALVASALAGSKMAGYLGVWRDRAAERAQNQIGPETELARLRNEVKHLDRDIDAVKSELAEANVAARLLAREVEEARANADLNGRAVRERGEMLKAADPREAVSYCGRVLPHADARDALANDVRRHQELRQRLKAKEQALAHQDANRLAIQEQLQTMIDQKEQASLVLQELDSELKMVKLEQMRARRPVDDGRLSDIKTSTEELRRKLMVMREKQQINEKGPQTPKASEGRSVEQILAGLDGADKTSVSQK